MNQEEPIEQHPHDSRAAIPDRLPAADIRALSRIDSSRAALALFLEWAGIVLAIVICEKYPHPALYVLAVVFIAARQHALAIIAHDASHFRLFPGKLANDLAGNLFCMWPTFAGVNGFRLFHGEHHRFTNVEGDGNRVLWRTHDANGKLVPLWVYPKSVARLLLAVCSRVLVLIGPRWILRGVIRGLMIPDRPLFRVLRPLFLIGAIAVITLADAWMGFLLYWIVPYCTWHIIIQYIRLICEHSAVRSADSAYAATRTTIPGFLGRLFVLPHNVGYHVEHHWYPSVPFYRLPELHERLMREPNFRANANVHHSIISSLRECTSTQP